MKYFKKELWASLNSADNDVSAWAEKEYERKFVEYAEHLNEITPRLAKNASRFFNKVSLHDGVLLSFSVGDALDVEEKEQINKLKTQIRVKVRSAGNGTIYTLNYSGISRCTVDFPGAFPLFYEPGDPFGHWGHDELSDANNGLFQHEVLFSSGATICIVFQRFSYQKRQPQKKRDV